MPSPDPSPKLPQYASPAEISARAAQLRASRATYTYESPATIPGISFIKGPFSDIPAESPSLRFRLKVGLSAARLIMNNVFCSSSMNLPQALFFAISTLFDALLVDPENFSELQAALTRVRHRLHATADIAGVRADATMERSTLALMRKTRGRAGSCFEEAHEILQPYRNLYKIYRIPPVADVFMQDNVFARMRTAGFNPMTLHRVKHSSGLPFWVDLEHLPCKDVVNSTGEAIYEGFLYAMDLSFVGDLNPIPPPPPPSPPSPSSSSSSDEDGKRKTKALLKHYIPTKALFAQAGKNKTLEPVAIQMGDEIVFPHMKDTRWEIAKMAVNTCDAVHHELISHLGRTHLLIEPFIAATHRQLPATHPVHALLLPHFEGTVFINDTAARDLVSPGGDIERIFAGDISSVMRWTAQQVQAMHFNTLFPDVELASRGLLVSAPWKPGAKPPGAVEGRGTTTSSSSSSGRNELPFAYRDDALTHFEMLYRWVKEYVDYYYSGGDEEVRNDEELQAWAYELTDGDKGQLKGFGDHDNGTINTVYYLSRCLTLIIFSASVQHAAVNFPQKDLMSYAPAVAGAQYGGGAGEGDRVEGECADVQQWCDMLTPPRAAIDQLDILHLLGDVYYTQLGRYKRDQFAAAAEGGRWPRKIRDAHARYMQDLKTLDDMIVARERHETLKYHYLRPKNVPQSINI